MSITRATVAAGAFFAAVVLPRATLPMADGDAWWHIHAGEEILATGTVPDTNTWTIAGEGFRWISQDWLSNVLMALLFNAGPWGIALLSLTFALIVVAAFGLLWRALGERRPPVGWFARMTWLTVGLIVAGPIIGIRVQTIDLLMTAAVVLCLWSYVARSRMGPLVALPLLTVAWVNLHAGWVMLFLLGGAVVAGEALDRWRGRALSPPALDPAATWRLGASLAISALALVLNPSGPAIYAYPFVTASIGAHRDFLVEWSPPNLGSFEGQATVAFVLLGVVPTVLLGRRTLRAADLLWLAGLTVLALSAVRFALFLGPIGAALAATHLARPIERTALGRATAPILGRFARVPASARERGANLVLLAFVLVVGGTLAAVRASPAAQQEWVARAVPLEATDWIRDHAPRARIFNTYAWGGFLSRALPDARVYIDGRSDIYGDGPIQRYAATLNVSGDPREVLDASGIDVVVIRPDTPLNDWLAAQPGWSPVYGDELARVWQREEAAS